MNLRRLFSARSKRPLPRWLPHVLVGVVYLFCAFYYMGPSVTNCTDTLYGFGDNTAGPIWRYSVSPTSPLWGYENVTNYPVGENLASPVHYSGVLQYTLFWGLAKLVGPVCGFNLVNIIGFVTSAMVMYGFIYALTRRRWIALLAGYAASFAPYYQMKVGGHPSYGYQALLIGAVWAFYNLVTKRRRRDAVYMALLTAACFYFDPYFSLMVSVCLLPLYGSWAALSYWRVKKRRLKKTVVVKQLHLLLLSAAMTVVLLIPLITITLSHAKEISASVSALRGNVLFEARACSNLPHEYALPFVLHPIFGKLFGKQHYQLLIDDLHSGFDCGIGEDTVGISIIILLVTLIGLMIIGWEQLNKRRTRFTLGYDKKLAVIGLLTVALLAMVMAFPPFKIWEIPTPSYALLMVTTTWRTLTRFYVIVNFAVIALFSIVLVYFSSYFNKYRKILCIVFVTIFLVVAVEYQAFKPLKGNGLSTFSFSRDVPAVYTWLRDQSDISEIAEYPLERSGGESNAMAYYVSMQLVHKKKMFNANIPNSVAEEIKASLKDISDPQTIDTLYSAGIDAVVIHGVDEKTIREIPNLEVVYASPQAPFNLLAFTPLVKKDNVVVVRLKGMQQRTMMAFEEGFVRNTNIIRSAVDWEYEALNKSKLKVIPVPGGTATNDQLTRHCFMVRMAGEGDNAVFIPIVDGVAHETITLTSDYQPYEALAKDTIVLTNEKGFNMRVKDLGCKSEES